MTIELTSVYLKGIMKIEREKVKNKILIKMPKLKITFLLLLPQNPEPFQ